MDWSDLLVAGKIVLFFSARNDKLTFVKHKSDFRPCDVTIDKPKPDPFFDQVSIRGLFCNGPLDALITDNKFSVSFESGNRSRTVEMELKADWSLVGSLPYWGKEESVSVVFESEESHLEAKPLSVHFTLLPQLLCLQVQQLPSPLTYLLEWSQFHFPESTIELRPLFLLVSMDQESKYESLKVGTDESKNVAKSAKQLKVNLKPSLKYLILLVDAQHPRPTESCHQHFIPDCSESFRDLRVC